MIMRCYEVLSKPTNCKISDKNKPFKFTFFCKENYTSYYKEKYDKCLQRKDKSRCTEKFKTYN